jgi:N-acetyl-beta-hexosaminidase
MTPSSRPPARSTSTTARVDAAFEAPGRSALNTLADVYHFDTAPQALTEGQSRHTIGVQASLWTES